MHRHGYQGRKFGRERNQRQALLVGMAKSLVLDETVETTWPKAKELSRFTEKLVNKAKQTSLHSHRQVFKSLGNNSASHKLISEIAPKLSSRSSGYFKVERTAERRGDNSLMAKISFVDDLSKKVPTKPTAPKATAKPKPTTKPKAAAKPKESRK